jgi:diguanylate cyclase (GGDEF)-like protein/PAS domain S-box-containing protein
METDLFGSAPATPATPARPLHAALQWLGQGLQPSRWLGTLKLRLALGALVALWVGMALTAWHMAGVAERETLLQADQREHADARRIADVVGHRVAEMQRALRVAATQLDPATFNDPQRLAAYFERQPVLRTMFSNLYATTPDGTVRLMVEQGGARVVPMSIADRDYFRRTVSEAAPMISEPFEGRVSGEPVVVFTHPLTSGSALWGVLGGTLRLASRDLLHDLAQARAGDQGALTLVTDRQGRLLVHPKRGLLLHSLAEEPRLEQAHDQWQAAGRPDSSAAGTWRQPHDRVAQAAVAGSGWLVWRALPQAAVLAPLRTAWSSSLAMAAAMALGLTLVMAGFLVWQLRPLARLQRRAADMLRGDIAADAGWPEASGEIDQLGRTLRHVWAERTQMESFNAQVLQKLSSVLAASPIGLAFTRHSRFELVSAELCALLRRDESELIGQPTQVIFASNEDFINLGPMVGSAFARGESYVGEWRLLRADGTVFWARMRARPVVAGDPGSGTIWSVNDISDQVQQREQLQHAAQHDPLTGVANRNGFERALQPLFAADPASRLAAVLMIDLDHFKPINDNAGHAAGDAMLVAVARAIAGQVRATDLVARLGGDEFGVLLPGCDQGRALAVAEKVRDGVAQLTLIWEGRSLRVGASVGVAAVSPRHASAADWLREADAACYEAKRAGRNAVRGQGAAAAAAPSAPALRVVA